MDDHDRQLLLLGREHFERGEYEKAGYLLRQVAHRFDRFADVHHMLGVIAHNAGDFARAQTHFERAIALNPNYTEAQLSLMVTYNELGQYEAARRLYAQVQARAPSGSVDPFVKGKLANLHAEIAQAYVDAGMLAQAIRELDKAVQLAPHFADLHVKLGLLYRDIGEIGLARDQLVMARDINPNYVHARLSLGTLLLGIGQHEAARQEFDCILKTDPGHKLARMYLRLTQTSLRNSTPEVRAKQPSEPA
ncbi:MAG: tetratricopeptide repeat protein [Polyangiaceae bacterium]